MGGLGGGDDLLIGRIGSSVGNILPHRSGRKPGVLQDHAIAFPQRMAGHPANVGISDLDASLLDVIKPHEQVDDGGLSASRGTYDGHALTALQGQIQVADQLLLWRIGESHVGQRHATVGLLQHHGIGGIRDLGVRLDQLKEPCGAGRSILQLGDNARDLVERLGILVGIYIHFQRFQTDRGCICRGR